MVSKTLWALALVGPIAASARALPSADALPMTNEGSFVPATAESTAWDSVRRDEAAGAVQARDVSLPWSLEPLTHHLESRAPPRPKTTTGKVQPAPDDPDSSSIKGPSGRELAKKLATRNLMDDEPDTPATGSVDDAYDNLDLRDQIQMRLAAGRDHQVEPTLISVKNVAGDDNPLKNMAMQDYGAITVNSKTPPYGQILSIKGNPDDAHVMIDWKVKAADTAQTLDMSEIIGQTVDKYAATKPIRAVTQFAVSNQFTKDTVEANFPGFMARDGDSQETFSRAQNEKAFDDLASTPNGKALFVYANNHFQTKKGWNPTKVMIAKIENQLFITWLFSDHVGMLDTATPPSTP